MSAYKGLCCSLCSWPTSAQRSAGKTSPTWPGRPLMQLSRSSHWIFEHPLQKNDSSHNLKSRWWRHLLKQQYWLLNIFELFRLGWGCTHSRLIRGGQKSYRHLKPMENFYVFPSTARFLSEILCQRALSACCAHLQGTKTPVLSGGCDYCEDPHEQLEQEQGQMSFPAARRCQWMQGKEMLVPLKRLPWWDFLNIFKSYWTWIFYPKKIPKVVLPHLQVEIYLIYFLVWDIPFSSEDVWAKHLKSRVAHNWKRKWLH